MHLSIHFNTFNIITEKKNSKNNASINPIVTNIQQADYVENQILSCMFASH